MIEYTPGCYYVERGEVITIENHLVQFLGGAVSTDADYRIEGSGWWRKEAPTANEVQYGLIQANLHKPDIMITHDCPINFSPYKRDGILNPKSKLDSGDTSTKLQQLYDSMEQRPSFWFHGHYHRHQITQHNSTQIIGCGIAHNYRLPAPSGWMFNPETGKLAEWNER